MNNRKYLSEAELYFLDNKNYQLLIDAAGNQFQVIGAQVHHLMMADLLTKVADLRAELDKRNDPENFINVPADKVAC